MRRLAGICAQFELPLSFLTSAEELRNVVKATQAMARGDEQLVGELLRRAASPPGAPTPSQAFTGEGRATVADKLEPAVSLAECLNAVMSSLLEDRAAMTAEEQATLATIGANVEMWARDLRALFTAWTGGGQS